MARSEVDGSAERRSGDLATGAEPMLLLVVSDVRFYRESVAAAVAEVGMATVCRSHDEIGTRPLGGADAAVIDLPEGITSGSLGALRRSAPSLGIVGLMVTSAPEAVLAAAAMSVRAFVSPDQSLSQLVGAVERAVRGEAVCPPAVADHLFDAVGSGIAPPGGPAGCLTARERQIASLLQKGLSNKEIAATLVIEPATVKNHVHSILGKLHVRRRGQVGASLRGGGSVSAGGHA